MTVACAGWEVSSCERLLLWERMRWRKSVSMTQRQCGFFLFQWCLWALNPCAGTWIKDENLRSWDSGCRAGNWSEPRCCWSMSSWWHLVTLNFRIQVYYLLEGGNLYKIVTVTGHASSCSGKYKNRCSTWDKILKEKHSKMFSHKWELFWTHVVLYPNNGSLWYLHCS